MIDLIVHRRALRRAARAVARLRQRVALNVTLSPEAAFRTREPPTGKSSPGFSAPSGFGIKLGLENSRRLFAALEVPSPNERIIHVAGTNGKGSTCALIDSIARAAGYRTGLFTSPHLITFRERIQVEWRTDFRRRSGARPNEDSRN